MPDQPDAGAAEGAHDEGWTSWAAWLDDGNDLAGRLAEVAAQIRTDWEQLSARDAPWTTDTIMNEVVNSWERWTPLLGEAVQHGVEGAAELLRTLWPDAPDDLATWRSSLRGPIGAGSKYVAVSEDVAARMLGRRFDSVDAVETFANLGGMWAKDVWRRSAQVRQRFTDEADPDDPATSPDDPAASAP